MDKNIKYYIFWSILALIFTVVVTSSTIGLQYWLSNQEKTCPIPQATTITVEKIPIAISLETHEADRSSARPTKWIDPDNQTVHYIYADGSGRLIPMYGTVPPVWYENMLQAYRNLHGEQMPQEIVEAVPWEWKAAVMPQVRPLPEGGNTN